MGRLCSVCAHAKRLEIERAIVAGHSIRALAKQYGLSPSAIGRHRDTHLRKALGKAVEEARLDLDVDTLVAWTGALHTKTLILLERAELEGDLGNARGFIREARENIVLVARLAGVLDAPTVNIDARRQVALFARLDETELRALARGEVVDGEAEEIVELVEAVA